MAGGKFSLANLFGITLRESANDGSDFTNPDADYRRVFLGEDGQLHAKDSSGTVTDLGGSVADILDLPTAETDDTLVLAPDGAGGVEFRAETGGGGAVGYAPFAAQIGVSHLSSFAATRSLAAVSGGNAGACGAFIPVPAPMKLRRISCWNKNTATARTAEARVYSIGTSASAAFVTGTDAAFSFTPGAASLRSASVSGTVVDLDPGYYLVVIRNTSASQTFDVGTETVATPNFLPGGSVFSVTASIAALGATIDVTGWSRTASGIGIALDGEIFGTGAAW